MTNPDQPSPFIWARTKRTGRTALWENLAKSVQPLPGVEV